MRNFVVLHAIENGLPIPIGPQESELLDGRASLDPSSSDTDPELFDPDAGDALGGSEGKTPDEAAPDGFLPEASEERYRIRAAGVYERYRGTSLRNRFKWVSPGLFGPVLGSVSFAAR